VGVNGGVEIVVVADSAAVAALDVVKHFVLKLLPMQTTMTFELLLLD
jgi:hypothetical protein